MCAVLCAVPALGVANAKWFWPAHRTALVIVGILQLARVAAQVHAVRLGEAALALGFSVPLWERAACQAHDLFLPGGISWAAAVGFGCNSLLVGILMTPGVRTWLAERTGMPAARALYRTRPARLVLSLSSNHRLKC